MYENEGQYKLTKHQYALVLLAIGFAEEPGGCRYTNRPDGKWSDNEDEYLAPEELVPDSALLPQCVIAQLAHLRGVPATDLYKWGACNVWGLLKQEELADRPGVDKLYDFPGPFLLGLQMEWDKRYGISTEERREMLKEWFSEHTTVADAPAVVRLHVEDAAQWGRG